jgi:Tfp pilus assembly protein PilE
MKTRLTFSLIELLVVIALLTTLVSLLQPALKNMASKTRTMSCASQQKSIVAASTFHQEDLSGFVPLGGEVYKLPGSMVSDARYKLVQGQATHFVGSLRNT